MIVFTAEEVKTLFGELGNQIFNYSSKQGFLSKEYFVNGEWTDSPKGKVTGTRYLTKEKSALADLSEIWKYLQNSFIETPTQPDKILERLANSRLGKKQVTIFSPWGPRYFNFRARITDSDREIATLKEVNQYLGEFRAREIIFQWLLMPADSYGTEINGLDQDFVKSYFQALKEEAYKIIGTDINIISWSKIKSDYAEKYIEEKEKIRQNFKDYVKPGTFERCLEISKKFNRENARENAINYCLERLVEAAIIEEVYQPIKLSLVKKDKDILDGPLKRVYVIKNRAPWLGRNNEN